VKIQVCLSKNLVHVVNSNRQESSGKCEVGKENWTTVWCISYTYTSFFFHTHTRKSLLACNDTSFPFSLVRTKIQRVRILTQIIMEADWISNQLVSRKHNWLALRDKSLVNATKNADKRYLFIYAIQKPPSHFFIN
jgi:hypothetical protein